MQKTLFFVVLILWLDKNVIIPDIDAQCPMAQMATPEKVKQLMNEHPDAKVVSYINTTAEIKAISDVCCTSANGTKVVKSLSDKQIIFVPDRNLGAYIQRFIPDKEMILYPGMCPTHHKIHKDEILKLKSSFPNAEVLVHPECRPEIIVLVHPECRPEIIDIADHTLSTNGMVNHVKKSKIKEFIIGTEKDLCYRLKKENPEKEFYPVKSAICPNMKKITLEKVLNSLESLEPKIQLSDEIMKKAKKPLQKMMDIGRGD